MRSREVWDVFGHREMLGARRFRLQIRAVGNILLTSGSDSRSVDVFRPRLRIGVKYSPGHSSASLVLIRCDLAVPSLGSPTSVGRDPVM